MTMKLPIFATILISIVNCAINVDDCCKLTTKVLNDTDRVYSKYGAIESGERFGRQLYLAYSSAGSK